MVRQHLSEQCAIAAPIEEAMRWLSTPELMVRWILGAERVETDGDRLRLTMSTRMGRQQVVNAFDGEIVESSVDRLVRRYVLEHEITYSREVRYELTSALAGCQLTCSVVTDVDGLPHPVIASGARAERSSLPRSLDRLRLGIEQRPLSIWRRYRDSQEQPQPL